MEKIFEWLLPIKKDDGMVLRGIRVGETAPVVRLHLIDDSGKGADITGVDAVSIIVERSDGMKVALTLSVQAVLCFCPAVVELSFADERLSAVAGLCVGVIDFYSGDIRMTSARFRYNVEPGIVVSDNEVAGDPEYSMFVGAMTDLAKLSEDVSEAENARNVFEVFDPYKEYVRGNKVAFEGSSYVLIAERALGINPTDTGSWLCIAEKGDKGEQGLQGIKGDKGDKGDKGVTGGKIFSYALGYGKDVEVGSYKSDNPPDELMNEGIYYGDIIVDTDGGCIFQYVVSIGMLSSEGLLCIANPNGEKGDIGEPGTQVFDFPATGFSVGEVRVLGSVGGFESLYGETPNIEWWRVGDYLLCADGMLLCIDDIRKPRDVVLFVTLRCVAQVFEEGVFSEDGYGNVTYGDNRVGCRGYYVKHIDSVNKKIYLGMDQAIGITDSSSLVPDTSFPTPGYAVGDTFSLKGKSYALNAGKIVAIENNVVTYDKLGQLPEWETAEPKIYDNTFFVTSKPDIGIVDVVFSAVALGEKNDVAASRSFTAGTANTLRGYMDIVLGGFNYAADSSIVEIGHGLYLVKAHQHGRGWYNVSDPKGQFADVFGIGYEIENADGSTTIIRKNGYSLDWNGNMRFAGKVYECCEDGTGNGHELARASLLGFNSPYVARYSEDGDLYAEARDSLSYEFKTDADGLVYTHMVPQNTQSFMGLICYSLPLVPLSQGKVWVKFLMRTNQTVNPNVVIYNVKDKDSKALNSPQKAGSITGDGQWHEVLIEFDNLPEGAYTTNYIQIKFAGRLIRGSAYYNADGTLKNDAYFDVASWGIFTDKVSAESFDLASREHTGSLIEYVDKKTDNAMNYIGVVDALPTSANENDVYTVSPWENEGTYSNISMSLYSNSVGFSEWNDLANFLYSDVQSNYGCSYKLVIGGASYIYTECGVNSAGDDGFGMAGRTDDVTSAVSVSGATVTVYRAASGADVINKSYIYRSGEWIPLFG